jgi:dsDNA-specific endonuclease/ATPase MutS2
MELWKTRPGLSETLIRTMNFSHWRTNEEVNLLKQRYSDERYKLWLLSDECKISASQSIQECYLNYKHRKLTVYKKLNFSKIIELNNDIIYEICSYLK